MIFWKKILLIAIVAGGCVGCDQVTKGIAREGLEVSRPISYFGDVVRLQYEENHGGMLSFGATLSDRSRFFLLTVFVAICLSMFFLYTLVSRSLHETQVMGISLILGGGLSNLLDRLLNNGAVIDFLVLGLGSVRTAVFNFADVAILTGVCILLLNRSRRAPTDGFKQKVSTE
ncbi:MAG: signal peptidase II [Ignavibacteria bacterium]|nr:signal peptidase II [Ignavibacteria bacterium]